MDGLPFLPGNSFTNPTRARHHRTQTLGYVNGYATKKLPEHGVGNSPINYNQLSEKELEELANYNPILTYGQAKPPAPSPFVPAYVALDKKILRFRAWYHEAIRDSPVESYRVRPVDIFYYLVDDSMAVFEPTVENSGLTHGKLISRQRLPKNDVGETYSWKDLNLSQDLCIYGRKFHIYDCDAWTRDWLESEGILVNEPGVCASDAYTDSKRGGSMESAKTAKTPSDLDKLRRFLELDRQVLRFYCVWDDRDQMFGEARKFILHYYLVNDTVEVREVHRANDGRDPFPILISRQRVPKDRYAVEKTFPSIILEMSDSEVKDYFSPPDFGIGKTVQIYNRRFFLYDCDNFTKAYYWKNYGITNFDALSVDAFGKRIAPAEMPEAGDDLEARDSMHSCRTLLIEPPKREFSQLGEEKVLRFEAILDSPKSEDKGRRFIISYRVTDDMVTIYEPPVKNSGIIGGKFLEKTRVAKPGSTAKRPSFYALEDFYIGSVIDVFKHRFIITNADAFVLTYMEENPSQFSEHTISTVRERIGSQQPTSALMKELKKGGPIYTRRTGADGELDALVDQVRGQLKRIAITGSSRKDRLYLGVEMNRSGYIDKDNLRDMCIKQQLPCDDDIIERLAQQIGSNPDRITLEELRAFLEAS